jgi:KDO2-lipid IV(A) lauroyltransferase
LPLLHLTGYLLGWLFWLIPGKKRRITYINLRLCLPELSILQRHTIARRSLIHEAQTLFEIPAILSLSQPRTQALVNEVIGLEYLQQGMEKGHGVILAVPHLGNWELIGLYASTKYPMTSLYRPQHRSPALDNFIRTGRQRFGARLVPTDAGGVRALYKALDNNELLAILPDQDPGTSGGVFAPFFGHQANTMVLLSRLAQRNRATVLYCYTERLRWGRGFRMHFIPASDDIYNPDRQQAATAINRGLEQCIRQAPAQYWWSYKRFKIRPEGENNLYP